MKGLSLRLKTIDKNLSDANSNEQLSTNQKITVYGETINELNAVVGDLNQFDDHVRLAKLRSVRNYQDSLESYTKLNSKLDDNEAQLDKARQSVASVIWFSIIKNCRPELWKNKIQKYLITGYDRQKRSGIILMPIVEAFLKLRINPLMPF